MSKVRVKLRRPEEIYTVIVECDYDTAPLGYIKALAAEQVAPLRSAGYDLIEMAPIAEGEGK